MLILFLFLSLLLPAPLFAADCGGETACACGDTVTGDYTLTADLPCATGPALTIGASNITLDCDNFTISRTTPWTTADGDSEWGIYLNGSASNPLHGVAIRDCNLTGFRTCLRFREASSNTTSGGAIHDCGDAAAEQGYCAEVTQNSHDNVFDTVTLDNCADEGLHCSESLRMRISNSTISDAANENLYLLSCSNGIVENSILGPAAATPGVNSAYIKDSSGNQFTNNTYRNKVVTLIGASSNNIFTDGSATGGVRIEHYEQVPGDQASYRFPQNNSFINLPISALNDCVRIENAINTIFAGSTTLSGCDTFLKAASIDSFGEPYQSTDITFTGFDPYAGSVSIDGGVTVNIAHALDVLVQDASLVPLEGAKVQLSDRNGEAISTFYTDATGALPQQMITIRSGRMAMETTPHWLLVRKPGYVTSGQSLDLTMNTTTTVTLAAQ